MGGSLCGVLTEIQNGKIHKNFKVILLNIPFTSEKLNVQHHYLA